MGEKERGMEGILIERCHDVRLEDNLTYGGPAARVVDSTKVSATGNISVLTPPAAAARPPWVRWLAQTFAGISIAIGTAGIVYYLGWN